MKHLFGDFVFSISLKPILTARAILLNTFFISTFLSRHFLNRSKIISLDDILFDKPYFLLKKEDQKILF
jgi:hypothetical protein